MAPRKRGHFYLYIRKDRPPGGLFSFPALVRSLRVLACAADHTGTHHRRMFDLCSSLIGHGSETPGKVVAMRKLALREREERSGSHPGWKPCAAADWAHHLPLRWWLLMALMAGAVVAHAEEADNWFLSAAASAPAPAPTVGAAAPPELAAAPTRPAAPPDALAPPRMVDGDDGPGLPRPVYVGRGGAQACRVPPVCAKGGS